MLRAILYSGAQIAITSLVCIRHIGFATGQILNFDDMPRNTWHSISVMAAATLTGNRHNIAVLHQTSNTGKTTETRPFVGKLVWRAQ